MTNLIGSIGAFRSKAFQWFVVVTFILLLVYLIYRKGQKSGGFQAPKALPNSGSGIPQGWTPTAISDKLWNSLGTIFWSWTERNAIIDVLLTLTPDQLTAVYNDYNYRYGKDDNNKSLTSTIKGEFFLLKQGQILERLRTYGLN